MNASAALWVTCLLSTCVTLGTQALAEPSSSSLVFLGAQGDPRLGLDPLPEVTQALESTVLEELRARHSGKLVSPEEAKAWLGDSSTQAKSCLETRCMDKLARSLRVDRVAVAHWRPAGQGLAVRIFLHLANNPEVLREQFLLNDMD